MADKAWKTGIDLRTRKLRNRFKMFLRNKYLCANSESYCEKASYFCPNRFECRYHYLARRKKWYGVVSNQRRLFARLKAIYGVNDAHRRLDEILAMEQGQFDVTLDMVGYIYKKTYFCCLPMRNKEE